jgi:hypothetical protein
VTASGRKAEATCPFGCDTEPCEHDEEQMAPEREIQQLRADNAAMREALEHFMTWWDRDDGSDEPPADTLSKTRSILARVGGKE